MPHVSVKRFFVVRRVYNHINGGVYKHYYYTAAESQLRFIPAEDRLMSEYPELEQAKQEANRLNTLAKLKIP